MIARAVASRTRDVDAGGDVVAAGAAERARAHEVAAGLGQREHDQVAAARARLGFIRRVPVADFRMAWEAKVT